MEVSKNGRAGKTTWRALKSKKQNKVAKNSKDSPMETKNMKSANRKFYKMCRPITKYEADIELSVYS